MIWRSRRGRLLLSAAPAVVIFASVAGPAWAQAQANNPNQLEEIVVTAEKRSENVQQVPIAITAFSAQAMQDKGVTDIHSLSNLTPNVNLDSAAPFSGSSSVLSASIRGIGQDDFAFNLDPGVGVYIDGVYLARTVGANQNLLDVDRVEILKGPQGTLFGRNTIGGAISVVTRTPSDQFNFEGEITGGSFDRRDAAVTADIPITDTLLSSVTVSSLQRDGFQKIIPYPGNTGIVDPPGTFKASDNYSYADTKGGQNQQTLRTKLLWKPTDDLKITFAGDWTHEDTSAVANSVIGLYGGGGTMYDIYNACIAGAPLGLLCQRSNQGGAIATLAPGTGRVPYSSASVQTGNIDTTYANGNNFSKLDSFGGSVTAEWTLNDSVELKSISGYRRINWKVGLDQDGSTLQIQEPSFSEGQHQFSEEVQAIGTALDSKLNYVAGLYYFNEGGFIHDFVTFPEGFLQIDGLNSLDTSSYAGYFHSNYKLTDEIGFTLGARYSYEHKEFTGGQTDWNGFAYRASGCGAPEGSAIALGLPNLTCQQALGFVTPGQPYRYFPAGLNTQDFYEFTPTVGAEYHFTPDLMSYVSWSKGFKTGGWTTRLSSPIPLATDATFGPEKAETSEIGLKSEFLDHRLVLDAAGFYTEYSQIQLNQQEGASPVTKNLGSADILGAELEAHALFGEGMSVNAAVGYIDAYYTNLDPSAIAAVGPPVIPIVAGSSSAADQPLSLGSKLPKTPKWKFSISPEYDITMGNDAIVRLLANYTHTSSMFNDSLNTPQLRRPTTDILDTSIQYVSPDDRYEVIVGGTNITDERYITTGSTNTAAGEIDGTYDAPAEWYITLRVKFQAEKAPAAYEAPPAPPPQAPPAEPLAAKPEAQRSFQVFFDFDKSDITDAAAQVIRAAADAVKQGNIVQIVVTGHTDTVGTAKYNQALSERRAAAVKAGLVADGVAGNEITATGVGKTGLLVPTADGVREPQNRRAEIVLK